MKNSENIFCVFLGTQQVTLVTRNHCPLFVLGMEYFVQKLPDYISRNVFGSSRRKIAQLSDCITRQLFLHKIICLRGNLSSKIMLRENITSKNRRIFYLMINGMWRKSHFQKKWKLLHNFIKVKQLNSLLIRLYNMIALPLQYC